MALRSNAGHGLLILGAARSHSLYAPQPLGLLWTSDQLVAETSTWQHKTLTTNTHAPGWNWTHNLSRRAAVYVRHRPTDPLNTLLYTNRHVFSRINLLATDFFFQILAHPVFKMWVIQKPNKVALWNKRHFEDKRWRLYSMFKIFSMDICWINIKWGI